MTGPTAVSPTVTNPEWDITLTDGTDSVGFVLVDGQGNPQPRAIQRTPFGPRTALKTAQGASKYDDFELPYMSISQDNWSGGRGSLVLDDDTSRYYDGFRIDTSLDGKAILGPLETYGSVPDHMIHSDGLMEDGDEFIWQSLQSAPIYYSRQFITSQDFTTGGVYLWVKRVGSPGALNVAIYSNNSGVPLASLVSGTITSASVDEFLPYLYRVALNTGLTGSTAYHVVVSITSGTHNATNYWQVGFYDSASAVGSSSTDGSSWSSAGKGPFHRVVETKSSTVSLNGIFFEYKNGLYFIDNDSSSTSNLYLNGDRGAAQSNTGALNTLKDVAKGWSTNEWAGCVVKIIRGPGVEESQNWRRITGNTSNQLFVTPDWEVAHTTSTEYVITKSNKWVLHTPPSPLFLDNVSSVTVAGEIVYFCYAGDVAGSYVQRYQEYNNNGTWTPRAESESKAIANNILAIQDPDGGYTLWGAYNKGKHAPKQVWKAKVPPHWGSLYIDKGMVFPTDTPWDTRTITNIGQWYSDGGTTIIPATGFSTGLMAVEDLDEPVDITGGSALACQFYSPLATSLSTDVQIYMDDVDDLGGEFAPSKVLASRWYSPTAAFHHDFAVSPTVFTALPGAIDGTTSTDTGKILDSLAAATDCIFIGYSAPFHAARVIVSSPNGNGSTMSAAFFNGVSWENMSTFTDGTATAGATLAKTTQASAGDQILSFGAYGYSTWKPSIVNDIEAYWVRLTFSANLDADVAISEIQVCAIDQDIQHLSDGNESTTGAFNLRTTDFMHVGYSTQFNEVNVTLTATDNARISALSAEYFNGSSWAYLFITDYTSSVGITFEVDGRIAFSIPYDWKPCVVGGVEAYWIRIATDANISSSVTNDASSIVAYSFNVTRKNNTGLPLTPKGQGWAWVTTTYLQALKFPYPDQTRISSIGLYANVDPGSNWFTMRGGWHLIDETPVYLQTSSVTSINNLVAYGSTSGTGINPYILTEDGIYEIQQENGDAVVKLPIGEISALQSGSNGKAACTNDVYMYFNLGRKIERYYNGTMEDVGPDRDTGLPSERQGDVTALLSYPGRVYASISTGTDSTKQSSVLMYDGSGWHEVYRSPLGEPIYNLYYQSIPGSSTGRLWISQLNSLLWVRVSTNPDTDDDYAYFPEGYITTGWIYGGMRTIKKVYDSLTILMENASTGERYIRVEYQNDDDTSWTAVSSAWDEALEEIDLATTRPTGRRIRFRVHLNGYETDITPVLIALVLDMYGVVPIKYQYTFTGRLAELSNATQNAVNLDGQDERALGYANAAETALALLDSWTDNASVLTMNSRYSVYNGKTVLLTAPAHAPISINSGVLEERHILNITAHDL